MNPIARIDDEVITAEDFLRTLKLTGQFAPLVEQVVRDRLAVHAARRQGIAPTPEEVQERADQFRRVLGLHRAVDTNNYLNALGVSLDEFEQFIVDGLCQEKMLAQVCSDQVVADYFAMHSPRFDSVDVRHLMLDSEGKARELLSLLQEDPDGFEELAAEHAAGAAGAVGADGAVGVIGAVGAADGAAAAPARIMRGTLPPEVEAKVFNAAPGQVLGPFPSADGSLYELFAVSARHPAALDDDTAAEIKRLLREQWLSARAREHVIAAG